MNKGTSDPMEGTELRRRAEVRLQGEQHRPEWWTAPDALSPDAARSLVHELQVHQVELEIQNEELRTTQTRLEASHGRYQDLYELAPVGYLTADEDGTLLEANLTFATLLGMDRSAILRRPLTRLVVPEDQDTLYLARRRLFETGQHQSFEARLRRQKGDPLWVSFEMVPSRNGGGGDGQARFLAAVSDISQRKAAEEELRRQNDELSRFATTVSHDLRSPLVTVKTFLGYLDQNLADGEVAAVTEDMGFIHTAVDRMERLMEELLQLSRAGRTVVKALRVPLQAVVDEALALVAGQVSARGVNVTVTDAPVVLVGDRERLVGVFQNLLDNAVKFLGDQPSPRIEVGAETTGDEVVIFVRDNGIGIEPLATLRIFGVFEQLDPGSGGTGLGLALVKRTIEGHGGRIWVEGAPGEGARFYFTLPKA